MLLLRADASASIGAGHFMRSLALGQSWKGRGDAAIASVETTSAMSARAEACGIRRVEIAAEIGSERDGRETADAAKRIGAAWVAADGYKFGESFQRTVRANGIRLLLFDDFGHSEYYDADLVVNQNPSAAEDTYQARSAHCRPLLGAKYFQLRGEFLVWREWTRATPERAAKILVTLGASDVPATLQTVVDGLSRVPGVEAKVLLVGDVTSPSIPEGTPGRVSLVRNPSDLPGLMAESDLAILGGGATVWEAAFMGLPCLTVVLADNQWKISEFARNEDLTVSLGWHESLTVERVESEVGRLAVDVERRREMSRKTRSLIDGHGPDRVIEAMLGGKASAAGSEPRVH